MGRLSKLTPVMHWGNLPDQVKHVHLILHSENGNHFVIFMNQKAPLILTPDGGLCLQYWQQCSICDTGVLLNATPLHINPGRMRQYQLLQPSNNLSTSHKENKIVNNTTENLVSNTWKLFSACLSKTPYFCSEQTSRSSFLSQGLNPCHVFAVNLNCYM